MPHSSDDPSSDRISAEAPSAQPTEGQEGEPTTPSQPATPAENIPIASDLPDSTAEQGEAPRLPRRRRRRRRPPRAAEPAGATAAVQGQGEQPTTAADASQSGDLGAAPPLEGEPRRRRRRRRGQHRDAGSREVKAGEAAQAAERATGAPPSVARPDNDPEQNGASQGAPSSDRELREGQPDAQQRRRRRRRRPALPGEANAAEASKMIPSSADESTPAGVPRHRSAPYRGSQTRRGRNGRGGDDRSPDRGPVGDNRRPSDPRARGKGAPRRSDRRQGRDRDAPRQKPEQRLYALEAVVDRGFEDVVDAADDNLTRRVHWTITKRTVADQESGKPISATYVLKRDGVDTEYPGLGAARAAANKTIVHPEKLTLSKADHAAEHAATKK